MKFIPCIFFILTIIIIILVYQIKKKIMVFKWLIIILRIILPIISFVFFGPILVFFSTFFDCQDGHAYVSVELKCRTGNLYYLHLPFVVIAIFFHFIIALITNTLYYKSIFHMSRSDALKKTNSIPDIFLFFTKAIIIILFILEQGEEKDNWCYLFILILVTGFNAYVQIYYKNRLNIALLILNITFSLILFFGYFTLFIGKIFKSLGYDGGIFFYFLSVIAIFLFIIYHKKNDIAFALVDFKAIDNVDSYVNYILKYYRLILNKNNSRNNFTILKSYIETLEENCIDNNCSLKIYSEKLKNGVDCQYLLYEYLDELFRFGITKFKNNNMLLNDYAMFLMVKMNNKKKAITVLNSIKRNYFSFHINYNIYRCRNIINKWPLSHNSLYYNYRNSTNEFRQLIFKTINLYSKFWTLLYETKFNHQNNFNDLYKFGRNIINFNLKIDELYNMIINTKTNNINISKLYSKYIQDILKDEEKYQKYQNNKSSIFHETIENEVKNFSNFNLDILKNNNNEKFLLISGRDNDLGKILDCSISASIAFGYTKEELIGKHMNTLIPDLFQLNHSITFRNAAKSSNLSLCEQQFQKKEYTPENVEGHFFGVLKSKFINAFKFRIFYIKTEDNIYAFVVEILNEIPYMNDFVKNKGNNDIGTKCCVLTNENFLIHEFTPNSIEQLGLNYRYMKSNNSIIPYIKQINDDYKIMVNDLKKVKGTSYINNNIDLMQEDNSFSEIQDDKQNNISPEIKRKIKDDLINKKYNKKCQITWKIDKRHFKTNINDNVQQIINEGLNDNDKIEKCTRISYRGSNFSLGVNKKDENILEIEFIMEIKKAILNNHLSGYYFYFSRIDPPKSTNFISYNNSEKNNYDKKEDLKIITKYKAIFKKTSQNVRKKVRRISHSLKDVNKNIITGNNKNKKFLGTSVLKNTKTKNNLQGEYLNILDLINNDKDINEAKNENTNEEAIIDETFIPNSKVNFSFDLKNQSYNYENDYNNLEALNEIIEKEATNKMNECQEYLKYLQKKEQESSKSDSLMEENESSYDDEDVESSDSDLDDDNSLSQKSIGKPSNSLQVQKLSRKSGKQSINLKGPIEPPHEKLPDKIKEASTLKAIQEEKEEKEKIYKKNSQITRNSSEQMKVNQGKNNMNNFYKVNLNKVIFMIFDFNKDMVVEGNN